MEKIEIIALSRLRNSEHYQFLTDVDHLITTHVPLELGIDGLYPAFKTALTAEDATMRTELGSLLSRTVDQLDQQRDTTLSAITLKVKATQMSPFANEAASAVALQRILDLYGDVRNKTYNEETAGISNLTDDLLQPENTEHLENVGISHWVTALKSENTQFQAAFDERNDELAARESGDVRALRMQIDPAYEQIVERINAAITLEVAKPVVATFTQSLNEKISYYKTTLAARASRAKTEAAKQAANN
jgi:hypothetical protein